MYHVNKATCLFFATDFLAMHGTAQDNGHTGASHRDPCSTTLYDCYDWWVKFHRKHYMILLWFVLCSNTAHM